LTNSDQIFVPDISAESNPTSTYLEGLPSVFAHDQQDSFKEGILTRVWRFGSAAGSFRLAKGDDEPA